MTDLSRHQLARRAFNRAHDQLKAAVDAGTVSAADAVVRFRRLREAYEIRKQDIELAAFLARHGHKKSPAMRSLDLALSAIDQPVAMSLDTATNRFLDAITKPYRDRNAA